MFWPKFLLIILFVFSIYTNYGIVLVSAASAVTSVQLEISPMELCNFTFKIIPEKRIPRTGNWNTLVTIDIYNQSGSSLGTVSGRSNSNGDLTIDICNQGVFASPGIYNFKVRGFSHLRQSFSNVDAFSNEETIIDFSNNNTQILLAGETSNVFDNKINSLDASTQVRAFYKTDNEKNDLNRDGKVNSLDFSNTVFNFYRTGD